jgi:hypothetical protein
METTKERSVLYDLILNFYKNKQINKEELDRAIILNWITEEEKLEIIKIVQAMNN